MSLFALLLFYPHPVGEGSEREAGWAFGCWSVSTHHKYPVKEHVYHLGKKLAGVELYLVIAFA